MFINISLCCRENFKEVVPFLLMKKDLASLESLATTVFMDLASVLKESSTKILVHILPMFAISKQREAAGLDQATQRRVVEANECYESLTEVVPHQVILLEKIY